MTRPPTFDEIPSFILLNENLYFKKEGGEIRGGLAHKFAD